MRLFIAEKPSLARAIAQGLGNPKSKNGYIQCGGDVVTWCFGHMFEQLGPDEYKDDWKSWRRDTLPMIPENWKLKPRKDADQQLGVIKELMGRASSVVHAGDPDREGQLLVDEVLTMFGYKGEVARIWLASLDDKSVAKALASLRSNEDYQPLSQAALGRSRADWLMGFNATRAMTLFGRSKGMEGTLSQGRVQTPTLALVVRRDRAIEDFKPRPFYVLQGGFSGEPAFAAKLQVTEDMQGVDEASRLVDQSRARELAKLAKGRSCEVRSASYTEKKRQPPLPHSLSSLQKEASTKFGMSAKQVLDTAQGLYEKKLTTYPRTDCRYLPEEQFDEAGAILKSLAGVMDVFASADASLRSAVWNTSKVTAHHAIIPTGEVPENLSEAERNLFGLIALAYGLQFHPPQVYQAQKIVLAMSTEQGELLWVASGRIDIEAGWSRFVGKAEDEESDAEDDGALPVLEQGAAVACEDVEVLSRKTKAPARFTEGMLVEAMSNIHLFVDDPEAKKRLKENEGIGTDATRAGIIETLKARGFLKVSKKKLVSTEQGRTLVDLSPDLLTDPVTTAQWERRLSAIAEGQESLKGFLDDLVAILRPLLDSIWENKVQVKIANPCPECGDALRRLPSKKKAGTFYWACFSDKHDSPVFLPDDKGKPGKPRKAGKPAGRSSKPRTSSSRRRK